MLRKQFDTSRCQLQDYQKTLRYKSTQGLTKVRRIRRPHMHHTLTLAHASHADQTNCHCLSVGAGLVVVMTLRVAGVAEQIVTQALVVRKQVML